MLFLCGDSWEKQIKGQQSATKKKQTHINACTNGTSMSSVARIEQSKDIQLAHSVFFLSLTPRFFLTTLACLLAPFSSVRLSRGSNSSILRWGETALYPTSTTSWLQVNNTTKWRSMTSVCTFSHTVLSVHSRASALLLSRYSGWSLLFFSQCSL